jgi:peptidoglycan hydrolase-like protein with peptidoglycan-binding domain
MKRFRQLLCTAIVASTAVLAAPAPTEAATTRIYTGAPGAPTIGIIGDSSIAAIRWSDSWSSLSSVNYAFNAESCRRTTGVSCSGREGYAPPNALDTLRAEPGRWGSVLVMVTGYNDAGTTFAASVDAIMAEAQRQGIPKVMWLTMRTADVSYVAPTFQSNTYTFRDNNRILLQKAEQYGGRLQIADWATYTADKASWFASDGVHYQPAGARGAGEYVAAQATLVAGGANITPPRTAAITNSGWVTLRIGDRGTRVADLQRALMAKGVTVFGGADGIFGRYTEAAVKTFQRRVGQLESGDVGLATAQQLGLFGTAPTATTTTSTAPPPSNATAWSTINVGERSSRAALAQQAIMRAGIYLRGGADGHFGPVSSQALKLYQQRYGLPATGVVDRATAVKMGLVAAATTTPTAPATWRTIGIGERNSATVRTAQQKIINAGIYLRGGADGWFGEYTATALRTYQSRVALPVTGVIDEATAVQMGLYSRPSTTTTTTTTTEPSTATSSSTTSSTTTSSTTSTTTVAPTTLSVSGRVWDDGAAGDSLFDVLVDTAVVGVEVRLIDDDGAVVDTTATIDDGTYEFTVDQAGTYRVEFVPPTDAVFVAADVGADDTVDSDVATTDTVTGVGSSADLTLELGDVLVIDAGLILATSPPAP